MFSFVVLLSATDCGIQQLSTCTLMQRTVAPRICIRPAVDLLQRGLGDQVQRL